jgi:predicted S18 family serine protease
MKRLFVLLVLLVVVYAECSGEASFPVPAVMGDSGNLVYISVKLIDGSGNVYITTIPPTGVSTQISAYDAAYIAFAKGNKDLQKCDVLVNIQGRDLTNFVDGPSAGSAITVTTYSALTGNALRNDSVITGTITEYGEVGPVGGIFEKAKAALNSGKKYLITPVNRLSDRLMVQTLEEKANFTVFEVATIDEALDFLINGNELEKKNISALIRPFPNVTDYHSEGIEAFKSIALDMINIENKTVAGMVTDGADLEEIKKYFQNEVDRQYFIFNKGYYFTAANDAFLNYIDAGTVSATKSIDLDAKYAEVESCLKSLNSKQKTTGNFEYMVGMELRQEWAEQKMREIDLNSEQLFEDKFFMYGELMYADAWCRIAKDFSQIDAPAGIQLNETKWKDLAFALLKASEEAEISSDELKSRLDNSQDLYEQGKYGASIYESTYALSMHKSELSIKDLYKMQEEMKSLSGQNRTSFWGKVYQGHGVFLSQGSMEDQKSAYKILNYALALDKATSEMVSLAMMEERAPEPVNMSCESWLFLILAVLAFVLLAYFLLKRKKPKTRKYKNYKR